MTQYSMATFMAAGGVSGEATWRATATSVSKLAASGQHPAPDYFVNAFQFASEFRTSAKLPWV